MSDTGIVDTERAVRAVHHHIEGSPGLGPALLIGIMGSLAGAVHARGRTLAGVALVLAAHAGRMTLR